MTTPRSPIGNEPTDPYDRYRAEAIEKDKHAKEEWKRSFEERKKTGFAAYLLLLFYKFLDFFTGKNASLPTESQVRKNLLLLQEALDVMKREDRSQDAPFLHHLSQVWHEILEDALKLKQIPSLAILYNHLIKEIESYPGETEHTLGYYFAEYAGQRWLPFPFMELVQKIHIDYQKNPAESPLSKWTQEVEALLRVLGEDKRSLKNGEKKG